MNRFFLMCMMALLFMAIVVSTAMAAPQRADHLTGSRATALGYAEDSSSATVTLIPAVSGQVVTLYRLILSASTADNVYLKCGTSQKTAKLYLGISSGLDAMLYPLYIQCGSGEALTLVKGSASTPIGVTFWYNQEPQ